MRIFSRNKKKSQYSTVCQSMLDFGYGFRTESYEGSGVRDALDIVFFECNDMGNYDIPKTMLSLYGGTGDDWQNLRWWVEACEKGDDPLEYIASGDLYDSLARILENELPIRVRYALWLTTEDAVREYYGGEDGDIDRYSLDDAIVLSDLGYDGVLFGFVDLPAPNYTVRNKSIKLYHGSPKGFTKIIPDRGNPKNDMGRGWYGSLKRSYAEWRGQQQAKKIGMKHYYVYQHDFDEDQAIDDGISYRRFVDDEEWARFVLENATGNAPENPYEITSGPYCDMAARKRAVEAYRRMVKNGNVDYDAMIDIMEPNMNDIQYVFHTSRSTKYLKDPRRYYR